MVIDPVCKMTIEQSQAVAISDWRNQTFSFCSKQCKETFDKDPERYAGRAA